MTVDELLRWSGKQLSSAKDGDSDSKIILCHLLGINAASLIVRNDEPVSLDREDEFKALIYQRQGGTPIAYITHSREFWSLDLKVNGNVLIPRHETELLVEKSISAMAGICKPKILEPGTGSGAVALALASELSGAQIIATDLSKSALDVAKINQKNLGLKNIRWIESDWFNNVEESQFDLICSNPPYVAPDDIHLTQGDLRFEPKSALIARNQGFAALYEIIQSAPGFLKYRGWLILEHGYEQAKKVKGKMFDRGFSRLTTYRDLGGNNRVTEGCWLHEG